MTALDGVASRPEASFGEIALAWVLRNPVVTSAIIGVGSVAQLDELVRASAISFTAPDLDRRGEATVAEEVQVSSKISAHRRQLGKLAIHQSERWEISSQPP